MQQVAYSTPGSYEGREGFEKLQSALQQVEESIPRTASVGRLYYLALPPSVYATVLKGLKAYVDMQPRDAGYAVCSISMKVLLSNAVLCCMLYTVCCC